MTDLQINELNKKLTEIISAGIIKLTVSEPRDRSNTVRRIELRPVTVKGKLIYQASAYTQKQVKHTNLEQIDLLKFLAGLLVYEYLQLTACCSENDFSLFAGGKHITLKRKPATHTAASTSHDEGKNYILKPGIPCPYLIKLGVMTAEGQVRSQAYDKFRQINRFLEFIEDMLPELPENDLRIVDFGCGKAYLTFAVYDYLTRIRGLKVTVTGIDLKEDVIRLCSETAAELDYENLHFVHGDIADFSGEADMVIALHACDTATDAALVKAVTWGAKVILAVPCCQHELLKQIDNPTCEVITRHGILKERLSSIVTDAMRSKLLEACGYETDIMEFIDTEHTPKNLLIRAVKRGNPRLSQYKAYKEFAGAWHISPYLEAELLKNGCLKTEEHNIEH